MAGGTLEDEDKRQIIQLLLVAEKCLIDAETLGGAGLGVKQGVVKSLFVEGSSPSADNLKLLFTGGHLNSAAIRFATIEEILEQAGLGTKEYREGCRYFADKGMSPRLSLSEAKDRWLHVMMRHNVAHVETTDDPDTEAQWRRRDRGKYLEELTLGEVLLALKCIRDRLRKHLDGRCSLPPPP